MFLNVLGDRWAHVINDTWTDYNVSFQQVHDIAVTQTYAAG